MLSKVDFLTIPNQLFLNYNNQDDNIIVTMIKNRQKAYFNLYKDSSNIQILPQQESFYKNNRIFNYTTNDNITNQHQDLANFRKFYEWLNIITYGSFNGIFRKIIIDVGGSPRLFNYLVVKYILRCELSNEDLLRNTKIDYTSQPLIRVSNKLIQDFIKNIDTTDVILNFTDVLYYISIQDLVQIFENFKNGVVGLFTMHVFTGKNKIKVLNMEYGQVIFLNEGVIMTVQGNYTFYKHAISYNVLNYTNHMVIPMKNGRYLCLKVEDRLDLNATLYIRGVITVTDKPEITYLNKPRVLITYYDEVSVKFFDKSKVLIQLTHNTALSQYTVATDELVKLYRIYSTINKESLDSQDLQNIYMQLKWSGFNLVEILILYKKLYHYYKSVMNTDF